jgi:uncharacterized protein (DUF1810 family)
MSDPFDLERFVTAQAGSYDAAIAEIRAGRKRTHWMWYVFPQLAGLGRSAMAQAYALSGLDEARAYLAHPVLGPRYRACVAALVGLPATSAEAVFGGIDAVKLRSSLTLFAEASGEASFTEAIARWFGGEPDAATLSLLAGGR